MRKDKDTPGAARGERLQKILAKAGVASRRAAEAMITGGRVRVNGRIVTELGVRADAANDRIELDGGKLVAERPVYILVHKPRGVVATLSDPEGRPTVGEMLSTLGVRTYPIGRLDFATSGVLLATNDGEFSNALLHPRGGVPKRYVLKLSGKMTDADLERWRKGIELEDGITLPAEVELIRHENDKTWLELTIREGRNQMIRRMGDASGFPVMRLARTSFAGITSEGLAPGRWRYLTHQELTLLKKTYGVPKKIPHDLPEGGGEASTSRRTEARRGGFAEKKDGAAQGGGGGARYGMGAPARRDADTTEDYGGGVRRGASHRDDRASTQPQAHHAPRDQRRGRGSMPMRTTGTGGGIHSNKKSHGK